MDYFFYSFLEIVLYSTFLLVILFYKSFRLGGGYSAATQHQYTSTIHNYQPSFLRRFKDRKVFYKPNKKKYKEENNKTNILHPPTIELILQHMKKENNILIDQPAFTKFELNLPLLGSLFCAKLFFQNTTIPIHQTNLLSLTDIMF